MSGARTTQAAPMRSSSRNDRDTRNVHAAAGLLPPRNHQDALDDHEARNPYMAVDASSQLDAVKQDGDGDDDDDDDSQSGGNGEDVDQPGGRMDIVYDSSVMRHLHSVPSATSRLAARESMSGRARSRVRHTQGDNGDHDDDDDDDDDDVVGATPM